MLYVTTCDIFNMRYIFLILLTISLSSCFEKGRKVANRYLTPVDIQHDSIMYLFAKKGQVVNEFLQIMNLDIFQREGNYYLGLFDNMQRKYIAYSIDSLNRYKEKNVLRQISPTGYLAAGFLQDSVIGLYSGEKKNGETNYGNEFHVFNRKGELLDKYTVTSKLYNFCISSETGLLYAKKEKALWI